jgi:hypothetical protein
MWSTGMNALFLTASHISALAGLVVKQRDAEAVNIAKANGFSEIRTKLYAGVTLCIQSLHENKSCKGKIK